MLHNFGHPGSDAGSAVATRIAPGTTAQLEAFGFLPTLQGALESPGARICQRAWRVGQVVSLAPARKSRKGDGYEQQKWRSRANQ